MFERERIYLPHYFLFYNSYIFKQKFSRKSGNFKLRYFNKENFHNMIFIYMTFQEF